MVIYGLIPVGGGGGVLCSKPSKGNIALSPQVATEQSLTETITDYVISQTSKRWISFLLIDNTNGVWCVCMEQKTINIYIYIYG